jgi:type II secretory pathway pseudopilin PulG
MKKTSPASARGSCCQRCTAVLLAMAVLTACSSSNQAEQRSKAATAAATARMAVQAWLAGNAPAHYAQGTLQATRKTLADISQGETDAATSNAAHAMDQIGTGLAAGDRRAVERSVAELETATAALTRPTAPQP